MSDTVTDRSNPDLGLLLDIFRTVATICETDNRIRSGITGGEFQIVYYPIRGQEMIPAGAVRALRRDDYMVTTYRCLHDVIAKGVPLRELIAEMLTRATGSSKGKGGAMHLSHPESGMMVTTGIVGGGVPIANGLALSSKLKGEDRVTLVSFGDGATSIGPVHEAFNLAALWDLPVIFLLQNNQYGEHTTVAGYTKTERFSKRAEGYGMPGVTVDGNDPVAVHDAVVEAAERARGGGGPTLVECLTYRLQGHAFGTSAAYMDEEELKAAWAADPVPAFRERVLRSGGDEAALRGIEAEVAAQVDDAFDFALRSPLPPPEDLMTDVVATEGVDR